MAGGKIKKERRKGPRAPSNHCRGGVTFHKSKGQHIFKNPLLVDAIVQKAGIKSTDVIPQIGPGTGNLTKKLLEAHKMVIAVELDPRMVLELQRRFQGSPFSHRLKKNVLSLLEKNYKTFQALQDSQNVALVGGNDGMDVSRLENQSMGLDDGMNDEMDVECDEEAEEEVSEFKNKVLSVLKEGNFEEQKASKLTQESFLSLLSTFDKAGIHFS